MQQGNTRMQEVAASNIIPFSKTMDQQHLFNADKAREETASFKEEISNDIAEMAMENIIGMLTTYGALRNPDKIHTMDLMMLENSIQALLYRYYQINHPLHEVTDDLFEIDNGETTES